MLGGYMLSHYKNREVSSRCGQMWLSSHPRTLPRVCGLGQGRLREGAEGRSVAGGWWMQELLFWNFPDRLSNCDTIFILKQFWWYFEIFNRIRQMISRADQTNVVNSVLVIVKKPLYILNRTYAKFYGGHPYGTSLTSKVQVTSYLISFSSN